MGLDELLERAERLALGYVSPVEGLVLIDAAIEHCSGCDASQEWARCQISHAITMAGWGLWRAGGAAIVAAFTARANCGAPYFDPVTMDS